MHPVPAEINVPRPGAVFVLGRDPGENEVDYRLDEQTGKEYPHGRPFVGLAGELLNSVLAELGLQRKEVNIGNVVPLRPPNNDFKAHDALAVEAGLAELDKLLKNLKPRLIIALGNEASYAVTRDWPTGGRGIYAAKNIEERRGYFFEGPYGWVLSTLHPAGVLRKVVPGDYLLRHDFRRARAWLANKLPRESVPAVRALTGTAVASLKRQSLLAWDVETKWDNTSILVSGFCGDDLIPYVGHYPRDWAEIQELLKAPIAKCGHNGMFDVAMLKHGHNLDVTNYLHDTQHMWWALEPELAGQDESNEDQTSHRMTRKGLAFLATIYGFNLPWWKVYPDREDPLHLRKMVEINKVDIWVTRQLASSMLPEIDRAGVTGQYTRSIELIPFSVRTHIRGLRIDEPLRKERQERLKERQDGLKAEAEQAGLAYIKAHDVDFFKVEKRCDCCGGGKVSARHCCKCSGLAQKPERKEDYRGLWDMVWMRHSGAYEFYRDQELVVEQLPKDFKKTGIKLLQSLMRPCDKCNGIGKLTTFEFNPMSEQQIKYFLYEVVGTPKGYQRGKVVSDEAALKKILRWCVRKEGK